MAVPDILYLAIANVDANNQYKHPMMQVLTYVCDRISQNLPQTLTMTKNVFHQQSIALSIS